MTEEQLAELEQRVSAIEKRGPALGVSFQGLGGALVFQTHVDQNTSVADLNALVDKLDRVAKRQQAKLDLVDLEKNLKVNEDQVLRMREDRARVEQQLTAPQEGRRNPNRATDDAKLRQAREQADVTEKRYVEIIGGFREQITAAKALIAAEG